MILYTLQTSDIIRLYREGLNIDVSDHFEGIPEINLIEDNLSGMRLFDPAISGDKIFYDKLTASSYYINDKYEHKYIASKIDIGDSVLEIGCGSGAFARMLKGINYLGADLSTPAVKACKASGLKVVEADAEALAKEFPEAFDWVVSFQVLEHINKPSLFIQDAVSCLKPGGKLVLSVPSADGFVSETVNNAFNMPPHHVSHWTDKALTYAVERLGMKVIDLHHEPLQPEHIRWFWQHYFYHFLRRFLLQPFKPVRFDFLHRNLLRISSILSWIPSRIGVGRGLSGHTVIVIAAKI